MGMTQQNVAGCGGDGSSGIDMVTNLYTASLPMYTTSLQKPPVAPGSGFIKISRRKLLKNLEVNTAQRINSWVDSMKASSPTHTKSPHSLAEDNNSSWMVSCFRVSIDPFRAKKCSDVKSRLYDIILQESGKNTDACGPPS